MQPRSIEALRRVAARAVELSLSRLGFATFELTQARDRCVRWVLLLLTCCVMFQLALLAASAALAVSLWERLGLLTLVGIALAYCGIGAAMLTLVRREIAAAPPLLAGTLAELARDREVLFGSDTSVPPTTPAGETSTATPPDRTVDAQVAR